MFISSFRRRIGSIIERDGFQAVDREWLVILFAVEDALWDGSIDRHRYDYEVERILKKQLKPLLKRASQIAWYPEYSYSLASLFSLRVDLNEQENLFSMAKELHRQALKAHRVLPPLRGPYSGGKLFKMQLQIHYAYLHSNIKYPKLRWEILAYRLGELRFVSRELGFPWDDIAGPVTAGALDRKEDDIDQWLQGQTSHTTKWNLQNRTFASKDAWKSFVRREDLYQIQDLPCSILERREACQYICEDSFRLYLNPPTWQTLLRHPLLMRIWRNKVQCQAELFAEYDELERRLKQIGWQYCFQHTQKSWTTLAGDLQWVRQQEEYAKECDAVLGYASPAWAKKLLSFPLTSESARSLKQDWLHQKAWYHRIREAKVLMPQQAPRPEFPISHESILHWKAWYWSARRRIVWRRKMRKLLKNSWCMFFKNAFFEISRLWRAREGQRDLESYWSALDERTSTQR